MMTEAYCARPGQDIREESSVTELLDYQLLALESRPA